jgi:hypothetical protein
VNHERMGDHRQAQAPFRSFQTLDQELVGAETARRVPSGLPQLGCPASLLLILPIRSTCLAA